MNNRRFLAIVIMMIMEFLVISGLIRYSFDGATALSTICPIWLPENNFIAGFRIEGIGLPSLEYNITVKGFPVNLLSFEEFVDKFTSFNNTTVVVITREGKVYYTTQNETAYYIASKYYGRKTILTETVVSGFTKDGFLILEWRISLDGLYSIVAIANVVGMAAVSIVWCTITFLSNTPNKENQSTS